MQIPIPYLRSQQLCQKLCVAFGGQSKAEHDLSRNQRSADVLLGDVLVAVVGGQRVIVRIERLYALGLRPLRLAVA